ncbi:hypothetical protein GCM10023191_062230 [Actinoallomurus oryzae]|uniref:Uncharacterized protein n=1 Tax=Actinoallomurus oryzae TaxID=502180 RepID=A0ABP8QPW5_9ACTN
MDHPVYAAPPPEPPPTPPPAAPAPRACDPAAAALGNASLLGVGYLMLGRRRLALAAVLVTIVLVSVLVSVARTWFEVLVLLWWAAVIAHGWFLARGRGDAGNAVRRQRLIALGVTVVVLLAVGLLRFDASRIHHSVTEARESGDCARVLSAHGRVWIGVRIADAPLTGRSDEAAHACRRLRAARTQLATGLTGDTGALKAGFATLGSVLDEPGNAKTVETVLNGFLGGLPAKDPCHTAAVTDWLRDRQPTHDALDRSAGIVGQTAPAALVGCGDSLMAARAWASARTRYQQLLDRYPGDQLTSRARDGVKKATQTIELENVRSLLDGSTDDQPAYCSKPAKYSGAASYGKGTNRALFYGNDTYRKKLPGSWRTTDPAHAVLVICAGERHYGSTVQRCPYRSKFGTGSLTYVAFHKIAIPVKVYELRTGKRVAKRDIQISGATCPRVIHYTTYAGLDAGPPSKQYVKASESDVRAGFRSLIKR